MLRCPRCGGRYAGNQGACPECEPSLDDGPAFESADGPEDPTMVSVARFGNAAEAGYFADELQNRLDIPVRLQLEQDFDALSGNWTSRMHLFVAEDAAVLAAETLSDLLQQDEMSLPATNRTEEARLESRRARFDDSDDAGFQAGSGVHWVPIVLALTAGSAAIWGARKLHENAGAVPPAEATGEHSKLWNTLGAAREGWALSRDGAPGHRNLLIDRGRGLAILREDADGDGVFESELRLRPAER